MNLFSSKIYLFILTAGILASCQKGAVVQNTTYSGYHEDLSVFRKAAAAPEKEEKTVEPTENIPKPNVKNIQEEVAQAVDSYFLDQDDKFWKGYTVLVYSGNEREQANQAKELLYQNFPKVKPIFEYVYPNYRVKVGQYLDRIEAQLVYLKAKKIFPNALITPERIKIKQ